MTRLALFVFALFASLMMAISSPVPVSADLERRRIRTGSVTWFQPGLGSCGWWNGENDDILAISHTLYDANHAGNCGQWVEINANGQVYHGLTVDRCEGCEENDIDLSKGLFSKIMPLSVGRKTLSWHFMPKGWHP